MVIFICFTNNEKMCMFIGNYSGNNQLHFGTSHGQTHYHLRLTIPSLNSFLCGNIFHNMLKSYIEIEFHHVSPTNFEPKCRIAI
jgi:hypothetical protein